MQLEVSPVPPCLIHATMKHGSARSKAWFFSIASLVLLLVICGVAALGLFTRPRRWSERSGPVMT